MKIVLGTLGMNDYRVRVGLRDPDSDKYVGDAEHWDRAETGVHRSRGESLGVPFTEEPGEAAFYGPKIDFVVKDVIGREWQLGTVQVDYQLPAALRPELHRRRQQAAPPGDDPPRAVRHMERFIGVLIEHFAGAFPLWLVAGAGRGADRSAKSSTTTRSRWRASSKAAGLRVEAEPRQRKDRRQDPRRRRWTRSRTCWWWAKRSNRRTWSRCGIAPKAIRAR